MTNELALILAAAYTGIAFVISYVLARIVRVHESVPRTGINKLKELDTSATALWILLGSIFWPLLIWWVVIQGVISNTSSQGD